LVIPGALAVAAAPSLGARDSAAASLAAAVMAGYDIMTRLGQAIDGAAALSRGIWPTYFLAPAAMAAVTARLAGLDAARAAQALGLALVRASPGVGHHNTAATSRWLAVGQAAETGLLAALAARAGFTCDLGVLDGGFLASIYGIKPNPAALSSGLGENFALGQGFALAGVSFKPWCAARRTMAATQALTELLAAGVPPGAITRIKAAVPPAHHRMVDHGVAIGDRSSFLTSLPYRLAVAALDPPAALAAVQAPPQVAENIAAFMARVEVAPLAPDDPLMTDFPRQWPARVEAMTAVACHQRVIARVPGDPQRPFDDAAVREKFHRFAAPAVGAEAAARILASALGLLSGYTPAAALMRDVEDTIGRVAQIE
jgi:2-methylcitrate dehydratase PrpD